MPVVSQTPEDSFSRVVAHIIIVLCSLIRQGIMKVFITHNGIQSGQILRFGYSECMIKSANEAFLIPFQQNFIHLHPESLKFAFFASNVSLKNMTVPKYF